MTFKVKVFSTHIHTGVHVHVCVRVCNYDCLALRFIRESCVAQMDPKGEDQSSVEGRRILIQVYVLRVERIENHHILRVEYYPWPHTWMCTTAALRPRSPDTTRQWLATPLIGLYIVLPV